MGLLKAELYKLFCDKQIKFVILIIVLYLVYSFFGLEKPIDTSFEGWLISNTTDSVFMLFFIGIVAATVFTIDYSNKTYIFVNGTHAQSCSKVLPNCIECENEKTCILC